MSDSIFPRDPKYIPGVDELRIPGLTVRGSPGLTKRELFAAMFLHAFTSGLAADGRKVDMPDYAESAVSMADQLLAELSRSSAKADRGGE